MSEQSGNTQADAVESMHDPVCHMSVTAESPHHFEFDAEHYYFCCAGCKNKFAADPHKYLHPGDEPEQEADPDAWYTCPMDPEVRQLGPGTCPKCGMALEPESPTLSDEENPELTDFRRRFQVSLPFTAVVFVLAHVWPWPSVAAHGLAALGGAGAGPARWSCGRDDPSSSVLFNPSLTGVRICGP